MSTPTQKKIIFTKRARAELLCEPAEQAPGIGEICGRTLVSVISSGSESGGYMDYFGGNAYPCATGYAAVLEITRVGQNVEGFTEGDLVFAEASHQLHQTVPAERAVKLPKGMRPEHAVLSRFPAVSLTSLIETPIRPTEPVVVSGLGIVGLMCAQLARHFGYPVYAVDPVASRRDTAIRCGVEASFASIDALDAPAGMKGKFGLALECSGNDHATLGLVPMLRKGGELSLIGVPWRQTSDVSAHELFRQIFIGYVHVRSGWEWSLPRQSQDFLPNSTALNFATSMRLIHEGAIRVEGTYGLHRPQDCNALYQTIAAGKLETTCAMFDWR